MGSTGLGDHSRTSYLATDDERGWSSGGFANHRLGFTGCQHSRLLALLRRLKPVHWVGGAHLRKMTKNRQQKEHPAPQKLKFCMKKIVFFLLKKTSQPRKKLKFCMKKMTKMVPKTRPNPAKSYLLHEKKCRFLLKKTIPH